jgi:predicted S18 family serine protease
VISSLKSFASQFSSLEADKIRLQEEVESTSSKLDNAIKLAAAARQNVDSLKKELDELKKNLKDEEKEALLCQSILALLGDSQCLILQFSFLNFFEFQFSYAYLL